MECRSRGAHAPAAARARSCDPSLLCSQSCGPQTSGAATTRAPSTTSCRRGGSRLAEDAGSREGCKARQVTDGLAAERQRRRERAGGGSWAARHPSCNLAGSLLRHPPGPSHLRCRQPGGRGRERPSALLCAAGELACGPCVACMISQSDYKRVCPNGGGLWAGELPQSRHSSCNFLHVHSAGLASRSEVQHRLHIASSSPPASIASCCSSPSPLAGASQQLPAPPRRHAARQAEVRRLLMTMVDRPTALRAPGSAAARRRSSA